jgi:hypothetical protein
MESPPDCEIVKSIASLRSVHGQMSRRALLSAIKTDNPTWQLSYKVSFFLFSDVPLMDRPRINFLSYKRLKKMEALLATGPDCVLVNPVQQEDSNPFSSRDVLSSYFEPVRSGADSPMIDSEPIKRLLRCQDVSLVGNFYSRDAMNTGWYYQVYGPAPPSEYEGPTDQHFLLRLIRPISTTKIGCTSPLLIVKNGPVDGDWELNADSIDMEDLIKTVWYYHKSGRDPAIVFGEREFIRFLNSIE